MLAEILFFTIPIVAIVGHYYVKLKKMDLERNALSEKQCQKIDFLLEENAKLRQRVENLEQIITSLEPELLSIKPYAKEENLQKQVEELARKLRGE